MLLTVLLAALSPVAPAASATQENCVEPVYLMVWVDQFDRTKSKGYAEGLRSSKIVARNGGQYQAVSPPVQVLEGEWPSDRAFVLERYPCMASLHRMWYSDEYQKRLKPLREGTGNYTVVVFKALKAQAGATR